MAAGDEQHQIGKTQTIGEPRGQRVAFQVIDGIERLAGRPRDRLAGHQSDDQAADQTGTTCRSNRIDVVERHAGPQQRLLDQRVERFDMGARGNLRNHAAIGAVLFQLAQDDVAEDASLAVFVAQHDGSRGFVAACFYAEDAHGRRHQELLKDCGRTERWVHGTPVTMDSL